MYRRIDDFLQDYENLTKGTLQIIGELTDEILDQPVADGHRTLGQIAWHIATTVPEMMSRTGLTISSIDQDSPPPESASEIAAAYRKATEELCEALEARWSDKTLIRTDDMYGEEWLRGATLTVLIHHEVHHRGQMTVLLRQAGHKVPGVMGPAKEEWAHFGMEAPPY